MPSDIQAYINGKESWGSISKQNQYLTLLGYWGDLEEWKNRIHSKNYKAFPLNDPHVLDKFPMLSAVFSQIGFELPENVVPDNSILIKERHKKLKLFCVEEAKGSKFIPKQAEFVEPFSVESVFGFGGVYPTGNIYAIIVFSREKILKQDASVYLSLNPAIKWATLGYDIMGNIFKMQKNESPSLYSFNQAKVENSTIEKEKSNAIIDELEMINDSLRDANEELRGEINKRTLFEKALKGSEEKLRAALEDMKHLMEFSSLMREEVREDVLLKHLAVVMKERFCPDSLVMLIRDREKNMVEVPIIDPVMPQDKVVRHDVVLDPTLCRILRTGRTVVVKDVNKEPCCECLLLEMKVGGYMCSPMISGGVTAGAVLLVKNEDGYWNSEEKQRLVSAYVSLAASSLDKVRLATIMRCA